MSTRRNIKMVIAYDGSEYAGFQRQRVGLNTIQGTLEARIAKLTGENVTITGAGRTDAGVHARGQVVNFFTESTLSSSAFLKALNALLPDDIVILETAEVEADFHARYRAKAKTYSYTVYNHQIRPVFERPFVYWYRYPLDWQEMVQAAQVIVGTHDFKSFQASGSAVKTTERTVHSCDITQSGPMIRMTINADGFLYHMVRNIMGTLLLVGTKRVTLAEFQAVIAAKDRKAAGPTAPACGLCLDEVFY